MQNNEVHKKDRKTRSIGIILIILLAIAIMVLAVALHKYWNAYTSERERMSRQLSDLQNKHAALLLKQEELEKQRANLETAMQRPLLDQNLDPQLALKLQRVYSAIDKLPTSRKLLTKDTGTSHAVTPTIAKSKSSAQNIADKLLDQLKSVVTISKNDKNPRGYGAANLELSKIQLKLMVNEMRWSAVERDNAAYQNCVDHAQEILLQNFDPNDRQVQKVAKMLDELELK